MMIGLREEESFEPETLDITKSPETWEAYRENISVIKVGEVILWGRIDEGGFRGFCLGNYEKQVGNILLDQLECAPARGLRCA
jgi:hypothetical protein